MPDAGQRRVGPWRRPWLGGLVAFDATALALIVGGWFGVSGEAIEQRQVAWLSLCVAGLVGSGLANGLWVLGGRREVALGRSAVLPGAAAWAGPARHRGLTRKGPRRVFRPGAGV